MPDAATAQQPESESAPTAGWTAVLSLPCLLTVDLPVAFTAKAILEMGLQTVVSTSCRVGADIPLRVNGALVAWGEFGVAGNRLVLRLTELA